MKFLLSFGESKKILERLLRKKPRKKTGLKSKTSIEKTKLREFFSLKSDLMEVTSYFLFTYSGNSFKKA